MSAPGTLLSVHFFPVEPNLPSLDIDELQPMFGTLRLDDGSLPLLIELAVDRNHAIPLVFVVTRQHVPERDRYGFQAAAIAPLARCSWVVKAARLEGDTTGVREALALADSLESHPVGDGPPFEDFDPYVRELDEDVPDGFDPLSAVRRCLDDVVAGLTFGPEVLEQPAFVGGT